MERIDLILLREVFRKRMNEEDFCIGQEQVEKLFRNLLNEDEPIRAPSNPISTAELASINEELAKFGTSVKDIFERDDRFFDQIRRR